MLLRLIATVSLAWATVLPACGQGAGKAATAAEPAKPFQITLELRDGSKLVGTPTIVSLAIKTEFAKMDLPVKLVESIEFSDDKQTAKIHCVNGDELKGVINLTTITLSTAFDKVSVPLKNIARISVEGGGAIGGALNKGLVLYYSFDKDEGDVVTDRSGHAHDGKIKGATWTRDGAIGGALSLAGKGNYVAFPCKDFPVRDEPRTLAAWVYQNSHRSRYYVVGYGDCNNNCEVKISLNQEQAGQFSLETFYSGWHSSASLVIKKWCHLVVTCDAEKVPKFYVNGSVSPANGTWGSPSLATRPGDGRIGDRGCFDVYDFDGKIDEVMIWDRALTPAEIQTLYKRRLPGSRD